jgi:hypothetical protein
VLRGIPGGLAGVRFISCTATKGAATVKKRLVIAITLMVLGLTAGGFSIYTFTEAAEKRATADRSLTRAEQDLDQAAAAPPNERRRHIFLADSSARSAAFYRNRAEQRTLEAWLFTAGAVVLIGSGVLVLLAHRRRAAGATADATATQVIQRI